MWKCEIWKALCAAWNCLRRRRTYVTPRVHGGMHDMMSDSGVHKTNALLRLPFYIRFLSRFMRNIHDDVRNMFGFFFWKKNVTNPRVALKSQPSSNIKWSNWRNKNKDPKCGPEAPSERGQIGRRECHLQVQIFTFGVAYESGLPAGKYAPWIYLLVYNT